MSAGSPRIRYSAAKWYTPPINLLELSVLNHSSCHSPPDILDLLYDTREKDPTNPRDRIYGLMELGPRQCDYPFEIDYTIDEEALWRQLLRHLRTCLDHPPI
jgi:hypothetical protein